MNSEPSSKPLSRPLSKISLASTQVSTQAATEAPTNGCAVGLRPLFFVLFVTFCESPLQNQKSLRPDFERLAPGECAAGPTCLSGESESNTALHEESDDSRASAGVVLRWRGDPVTVENQLVGAGCRG